MIRKVERRDARSIARIYNRYVTETTISFETLPVDEAEMLRRIEDTASRYPYFVYEECGEVIGYCYAHAWKERAAYGCTWETTVYISSQERGRGIGRQLMETLIDACRSLDVRVLIACITYGNEASCRLHRALGFSQVSHFEKVGFKFGEWLDVVDYELLLE